MLLLCSILLLPSNSRIPCINCLPKKAWRSIAGPFGHSLSSSRRWGVFRHETNRRWWWTSDREAINVWKILKANVPYRRSVWTKKTIGKAGTSRVVARRFFIFSLFCFCFQRTHRFCDRFCSKVTLSVFFYSLCRPHPCKELPCSKLNREQNIWCSIQLCRIETFSLPFLVHFESCHNSFENIFTVHFTLDWKGYPTDGWEATQPSPFVDEGWSLYYSLFRTRHSVAYFPQNVCLRDSLSPPPPPPVPKLRKQNS